MPSPQDLTPQQFVELYERPRLPVVITGLLDGWPAQGGWTPAALLRRFADHKFKVQGLVGGVALEELLAGCTHAQTRKYIMCTCMCNV